MFEKKMAGSRFTSLEKGGDKDMKRLEAEPERISLGEQEDRQGLRQGQDREDGKQAGLDERQGEGVTDRVEGKDNRIHPHKIEDRISIIYPLLPRYI